MKTDVKNSNIMKRWYIWLRIIWWALVNKIMNLHIPQMENLFTSWNSISFSRDMDSDASK